MILPLILALSFLCGILWNTFLPNTFSPVFPCFAFLLYFRSKPAALALLFLFFGFLRMECYTRQVASSLQEGYHSLEGFVAEEVDRRSDEQNLVIQTEEGRILLSVSLYESVAFGDQVKLSGFLERPEEGSYARYLFRYGILFTMQQGQLQVLESAPWSVRGLLYAFKDLVQERINVLYFEPQASLVSGLLLGSRKGMPPGLTRDFQATGLTHIVAVSGYNISLVIACVFSLFGFLSLRRRILLSLIFIVLFVIFVGASAAAVRAGVMGGLSMWGLYTGRKSQAFFALLWSAILMVLWNPAILAFDIGFQLSFASTLGLLAFTPMLERLFPFRGFLKEALLLTLSAQLATFPFIVFYFGRLSLISPLANLLVAPLLPFAMLFSFLSLLAAPLGLLGDVYVKAVLLIVHFLGSVPFADVEFSLAPFAFCVLLVGLFLLTLLFYKSKWSRAFGLYREEPSSTFLNPP